MTNVANLAGSHHKLRQLCHTMAGNWQTVMDTAYLSDGGKYIGTVTSVAHYGGTISVEYSPT